MRPAPAVDPAHSLRRGAPPSSGTTTRIAAAYLIYFLAVGLFVPYFAVFLRARGYDPAAIGWILALSPAMRIVIPPALGFLSDHTRGAGFWGTIAAWVAVAGIAGVVFGPTLAIVVAGLVLHSAATAPAIPLLDATLLREVRDRFRSFGRVRLWGSVGFLLTSSGLGLLAPDLPAWVIGWSLFGTTLLFALFLSASRLDEEAPERPQLREVGALLRSPALLVLLTAIFLNRLASTPYNGFYTLFVQDLGFSGQIVALNWAIAVTTECMVMLVIGRVIERYGSAMVLAFGVGLEALRWLAYAYASTRLELLLLAPFHGIAFCTLYVGSVRCFSQLVPERLRATGQGLNACASGFGAMAGFAVAGSLFEELGGGGTFAVAGLIGLGSVAGALVLWKIAPVTRSGGAAGETAP